MRTRILAITGIVVVWAAAYATEAYSGDIIMPVTPVSVEPDTTPVPSSEVISTLKTDQWYVIESSVELIALQSPQGVVDIEATTGPIKVRGLFVDGTGKSETRTYMSDFVYFVTAKSTGKTELILVPTGLALESAIVRQCLTVEDGTKPIPPPGPGPGPEPPTPPSPVTSFRVIFVKESGSTLPANQTAIPGAKAIRDYLTAKTTPEGGLAGWREYDPQQSTANEQPTMKALWAAVQPKLSPAPCLIIEVNGKATVMPFPANVADAIETLKKAGG